MGRFLAANVDQRPKCSWDHAFWPGRSPSRFFLLIADVEGAPSWQAWFPHGQRRGQTQLLLLVQLQRSHFFGSQVNFAISNTMFGEVKQAQCLLWGKINIATGATHFTIAIKIQR